MFEIIKYEYFWHITVVAYSLGFFSGCAIHIRKHMNIDKRNAAFIMLSVVFSAFVVRDLITDQDIPFLIYVSYLTVAGFVKPEALTYFLDTFKKK